MSELRNLDLSFNMLNSTVPQWLVVSKSLVDLNIQWNEFDNIEGGLSSMLNDACSLKSLTLSYNPFESLVFGSNKNSSRCQSYGLESLYISNTNLSDTIPDWLGQFKNLEDLGLYKNLLFGQIPTPLIELPWLRVLDLSFNQLSGDVPDPLRAEFSSLEYLDLSHNHLNGTIPRALARFSMLRSLRLSNNKFSGIFPRSVGKLSHLEELLVSDNPLEGVITELHFVNLKKFNSLSFASTNLSWKTKSDWVPSFTLTTLNLSSCRIASQFPKWLQQQNEIQELDLSNTNISGSFPLWFHGASLMYLDLSMNQISSESLAQIFQVFPRIDTLYLGNNLISGSIPNSLCNLENLMIVDVSRNNISGKIPNCFTELQSLYVINLSFNRLSGKIPDSLGNLPLLGKFHVNQNTLEGVLPEAMKNCINLKLLDLGENKFSGSIPTWIGERLLSLENLRLRKNMLNNTIPPQLCKLIHLQLLDLAENMLMGEIPHCIGSLEGMITGVQRLQSTIQYGGSNLPYRSDNEWKMVKVSESTKGLDNLEYTKMQLQLLNLLDLSNNNLTGVIPEEVCFLNGLQSLKLSHNQLTGKIPRMIGDLKWLKTLDLSNNKLSGDIPPSMSALSGMGHLNLSFNNLSGKIPSGNQLQTLNDQSIYVGNFLLCGFPLPKKCKDDNDIPIQQQRDGDRDDDAKENIWFWFVVAVGYTTGFWVVIGTLIFKRQWRIAYFSFAASTREKTLVMVGVKGVMLRKMVKKFFKE